MVKVPESLEEPYWKKWDWSPWKITETKKENNMQGYRKHTNSYGKDLVPGKADLNVYEHDDGTKEVVVTFYEQHEHLAGLTCRDCVFTHMHKSEDHEVWARAQVDAYYARGEED